MSSRSVGTSRTPVATTPPTVSRIRERPRGRVEIELDGVSWRVIPAAAVARAGIRVGRPLDRRTARDLARELRRADALSRAARMLAARDRSLEELDERLARTGVPSAARTEALAALAAAGLVDDTRVARSRAEELARRGYGDAAIRHDLERRGVAPDTADGALAALDPELERARTLVRADASLPGLLRRLSARGFSADTVEEIAAFAQRA